jgi:hypothetical protein
LIGGCSGTFGATVAKLLIFFLFLYTVFHEVVKKAHLFLPQNRFAAKRGLLFLCDDANLCDSVSISININRKPIPLILMEKDFVEKI